MKISAFAQAIKPSATLAAGAKAQELRRAGIAVFDFALGEPDFPTPTAIRSAAAEAVEAGATRYTPAAGTPALRQAVARDYQQRHGIDFTAANICISNGAKHALFTALAATLDPGDEVVIPTPYWLSYWDMVAMTGAKPVLIAGSPECGFKVSVDQVEAAATPKTRMLLLNSPSNPTGATYEPTSLARLAELAVKHDWIIVSDEIYEPFVYSGATFTCVAGLSSAIRERTLTINGVSKAFAMTGWRIGWTAGPAPIIKAMDAIQSQQTGCPSSVSQAAALAALEGNRESIATMRAEFERRRDFVVDRINAIPGLHLAPPEGAFYAFFDLRGLLGKRSPGYSIESADQFCLAALAEAHVNLVSGSAFGCEGFARLSFAASMEQLAGGLDALAAWVATLN